MTTNSCLVKSMVFILLFFALAQECEAQSVQQLIRNIRSKMPVAPVEEVGNCDCYEYEAAIERIGTQVDFDSLVVREFFNKNFFFRSRKSLPVELAQPEYERFKAQSGEIINYTTGSPGYVQSTGYLHKKAASHIVSEPGLNSEQTLKWEYEYGQDGELQLVKTFVNDSLAETLEGPDFIGNRKKTISELFENGKLVALVDNRTQVKNEFIYENGMLVQMNTSSPSYGQTEITYFDKHGLAKLFVDIAGKLTVEFFYTFDRKGRWVTRDKIIGGEYYSLTVRLFY